MKEVVMKTVFLRKVVCSCVLSLSFCAFAVSAMADGGDEDKLISPNTASVEMLASLPGMNRELAMAVVGYRETLGDLQSVDELLEVPGFTEEILNGIRPYISVDPLKTDCNC